MRVAHIAFQYGLNNTGGAAIAATRLHKALLSHGVESHYICVHQREQGQNVHELPRGWKRKLFLSLTKLTRCIWKFTLYRRSICLNLVPMFGLEGELKKINPDVVHVQWMGNDACSFEQIARLSYRVSFGPDPLETGNATTQTVFEVIVSNPGIKQKDLCDQMGISTASAKRHLALLDEFIEHRGSKKTGGYYAKEQGTGCSAGGGR